MASLSGLGSQPGQRVGWVPSPPGLLALFTLQWKGPRQQERASLAARCVCASLLESGLLLALGPKQVARPSQSQHGWGRPRGHFAQFPQEVRDARTFGQFVYMREAARGRPAVMVSRAGSWVKGMVGPLRTRKSEAGPGLTSEILFPCRLRC